MVYSEGGRLFIHSFIHSCCDSSSYSCLMEWNPDCREIHIPNSEYSSRQTVPLSDLTYLSKSDIPWRVENTGVMLLLVVRTKVMKRFQLCDIQYCQWSKTTVRHGTWRPTMVATRQYHTVPHGSVHPKLATSTRRMDGHGPVTPVLDSNTTTAAYTSCCLSQLSSVCTVSTCRRMHTVAMPVVPGQTF